MWGGKGCREAYLQRDLGFGIRWTGVIVSAGWVGNWGTTGQLVNVAAAFSSSSDLKFDIYMTISIHLLVQPSLKPPKSALTLKATLRRFKYGPLERAPERV